MTPTAETQDTETYAIIGAAMEVHHILRHGFSESVYQDALEQEFILRKIPHVREQAIPVMYKSKELTSRFKADFICHDRVVVELKALSQLSGTEEAQLLNYLRATGHRRGLLINFGEPTLKFKRMVMGPP